MIKWAKIKKVLIIFFRQLILIILSIFALYPVFYIVVSALKSKVEYAINPFGLPKIIEWSNFVEVFVGKNFGMWFLNSVILTLISVMFNLVVTIPGAFALSRYKFKMRETIYNFLISLMIMPPIIMIIPLYVLMTRVNLVNNYMGAILIYSLLPIPFSIYLLTSFFKTIPQELIDAARIDGCSSMRVLSNIILPISKPPIIATIAVNGIWVWNDLLIAIIFLQKNQLRTLMVGITVFKSLYMINIPLTMMGMLIAILPVIILYLLGQKYFIQGLIAGSLKD